MLPRVPLGTSSPRLPATHTEPGFLECLKCRWLPVCRTCSHPASSSSRMIALTFTRPNGRHPSVIDLIANTRTSNLIGPSIGTKSGCYRSTRISRSWRNGHHADVRDYRSRLWGERRTPTVFMKIQRQAEFHCVALSPSRSLGRERHAQHPWGR
jgi:hypothetical protein